MSARAAARSRSRSAASSTMGSWPSGASTTEDMPARPCSCTSRSRTAPSSLPSQPSSSRKTWARTGSTPSNNDRAARSRRVATRMSCSSSGSSPSRVPGSLARTTASWRRRTAKARSPMVDRAEMSVGPRSGVPGISSPEGQQPRLELGEARRLEPAGHAQLLHDRLQRVEPVGVDLDLDAPELHGALPVAHDDHRVVERDLRHVDTADPQREGAPAGAHLEHLVQPAGTDDGAQAASDRSVVSEPVQTGRGEDLGDLQALAQAAPLRGAVVLEGDLVAAAAAPGADDEAGAGDAPVVAVEIGVDQPARRAGERGHRPSVARLDGEGGEGGQPAFHRPQVEGVELPLDLDGVVPARLLSLGIRHRVHATAGSRPLSRGAIAAVAWGCDGNLRRSGATSNDG